MKREPHTHLFDVYALAPARSVAVVEAFRERWATGFVESADEYLIPRFAEDPEMEFASCEPLIEYLIATPTQDQTVYWTNADEKSRVRNAMLFFTPDGGLIVGISVWAISAAVADDMIALCDSAQGQFAYVTSEEPPAEDTSEFERLARITSGPSIAGGVVTR